MLHTVWLCQRYIATWYFLVPLNGYIPDPDAWKNMYEAAMISSIIQTKQPKIGRLFRCPHFDWNIKLFTCFLCEFRALNIIKRRSNILVIGLSTLAIRWPHILMHHALIYISVMEFPEVYVLLCIQREVILESDRKLESHVVKLFNALFK